MNSGGSKSYCGRMLNGDLSPISSRLACRRTCLTGIGGPDEEESSLNLGSYLDLATGVIEGSMPKRVGVMEEASG